MTDRHRIAMLGATSQLAKDYIALGNHAPDSLLLYARTPEKVTAFLAANGLQQSVFPISAFGDETCDTIINFVGVGDPARAKAMGAGIFEVTLDSDWLALDYIAVHPQTRYIFMSSGAVYGGNFEKPVDDESLSTVPINNCQPQDYYGIAKLYTEARHRALPERSIIDIRIFSYVSRTLDLSTRFLLADIANAIKNSTTFCTSGDNIFRADLGPEDLCQLLKVCISAPTGFNGAVDAFSLAPIGKLELLDEMQKKFGLEIDFQKKPAIIQNTGHKPFYYSNSKAAGKLGFKPKYSSLEIILKELSYLLLP